MATDQKVVLVFWHDETSLPEFAWWACVYDNWVSDEMLVTCTTSQASPASVLLELAAWLGRRVETAGRQEEEAG